MEIRWNRVRGTQEARPEAIDTQSSSHLVYLRKNIERIDVVNEASGQTVQMWQYDEATITHEEYAKYGDLAAAISMTEVSGYAETQEPKNEAMQANIEYIAMMANIDLEG